MDFYIGNTQTENNIIIWRNDALGVNGRTKDVSRCNNGVREKVIHSEAIEFKKMPSIFLKIHMNFMISYMFSCFLYDDLQLDISAPNQNWEGNMKQPVA